MIYNPDSIAHSVELKTLQPTYSDKKDLIE